MCGISGILNLGQGQAPSRSELAQMIQALQHRGPDGYGFYLDGPVGLAHARLSIIDLEGGDQPIHNEDRSIQVVFNGEIFNFLELRADLEKRGHRFYTRSDTEVIVHLYEEYGDDFVDHLIGQFAIALWDVRRQRLVLVRDRAGIRPLYYTVVNGRLYFASELKSLFTQSAIRRELDPVALGEVFTFWCPLEPHSLFRDLRSLPPGQRMVVEHGKPDIDRYWDWDFSPGQIDNRRSVEDWAEELRELMIDAVRLRLRSDVPVGAYLSGGLDSSVITSLIHNFTDTALRTFSIGFEDDEFDESVFQKELVKYLDTDHTHVTCTREDIGRIFPRVIWHTESTILRTAPAPLMLLSRHVRESGYKVVLTGEGADEVFGGYDIFKEAKIRRFCHRIPDSKLRPQILKRLYPYLKYSPASGGAFGRQFFEQGMEYIDEPFFSHVPRWTTTQRSWKFFSRDMKAAVSGKVGFESIRPLLPPGIRSWQPLNRDQYVENHTLLSGYLLNSQGDRMAMANSIEGRFPFLDHRVMEFAARIPPRYKIRVLNEKYLLKQSMAGLIPESIRQRNKQPYRAPDSQSFFQDGKAADWVMDLLSEAELRKAGYFHPMAVEKLLKKCATGRVIGFSDNMAFVGILSTMLLDKMFVQGYSSEAFT
ncbi:asparagine synthase, glutamine-hydrolyzing [Thiolapillus brandeum]|uniref:asparagine synthase (glutamine-hydrolyzing) n=2 Tax=Thiolapillus brandeum TaxID=1076588 RepID=A0A7U6GKS6_9GAMM|nr:asparagine synthase, glutamine-hydrolyzing [Thiolapillus brandeum]